MPKVSPMSPLKLQEESALLVATFMPLSNKVGSPCVAQQREQPPFPRAMSEVSPCSGSNGAGQFCGHLRQCSDVAESITTVLEVTAMEAAGPAATVQVQAPRDLHAIVSKRVVPRSGFSARAQRPLQLQLALGGDSPAAVGALPTWLPPVSLEQRMNNSFTSVTDECVAALVSFRDGPLKHGCSRRGRGLGVQDSPKTSDSLSSWSIRTNSTPGAQGADRQVIRSSVFSSKRSRPLHPSHASCHTPTGGVMPIPRSTCAANEERVVTIHSPQFVGRGGCDALEKILRWDVVDRSGDVEDLCALRRRSSVPVAVVSRQQVGGSLPAVVPVTPLSVVEELMNGDNDDDGSLSGLSTFLRGNERHVLAVPEKEIGKISWQHSVLNSGDRARDEKQLLANTTGVACGVRIIRRNPEKML
ncbi:hypothetical protein DQ04_00011060 [Trypanosoma grayi]|uniref:hypothetical protein n=1 Tax=Trypanosoma grayi TaxID=71804 RepID=UPI0004F41B90|nr:hypothetical protein DQ04_00011060 [Trypanosoma grayi]KEG15639.1 hypothetical protein DQ04_00011060 [Trypanosoma grayi]